MGLEVFQRQGAFMIRGRAKETFYFGSPGRLYEVGKEYDFPRDFSKPWLVDVIEGKFDMPPKAIAEAAARRERARTAS
jgi:hypothetical protein